MKTKITRWHEIDVGHRVVGQGSKCENIHGHRYRIEIEAEAEKLNDVGMVIDFSVIKSICCQWLEDNLDHKYLCWTFDPHRDAIMALGLGAVEVYFNPTAENIAEYLLVTFDAMMEHDIKITKVTVHETLKCKAEATW